MRNRSSLRLSENKMHCNDDDESKMLHQFVETDFKKSRNMDFVSLVL